jgi:hypothetical protein
VAPDGVTGVAGPDALDVGPVPAEEVPGDEEADGVGHHEEGDDEVEVEELGAGEEGALIVPGVEEAGVAADVREGGGARAVAGDTLAILAELC